MAEPVAEATPAETAVLEKLLARVARRLLKEDATVGCYLLEVAAAVVEATLEAAAEPEATLLPLATGARPKLPSLQIVPAGTACSISLPLPVQSTKDVSDSWRETHIVSKIACSSQRDRIYGSTYTDEFACCDIGAGSFSSRVISRGSEGCAAQGKDG